MKFLPTIILLTLSTTLTAVKPTKKLGMGANTTNRKYEEFDCPNVHCLCSPSGVNGEMFEFPKFYRHSSVAGELGTFCDLAKGLVTEDCTEDDINEWFDIFDDIVDPNVFLTATDFKACFKP